MTTPQDRANGGSAEDKPKPRLGYVLPSYSPDSGEHHAHIPRLLTALSRWLEVEVIVWDCRGEPVLPGVATVFRLASESRAARFLELRRLLRQRVRAGCRRWFVRSATPLALAAELAGAEVVLWWCGVKRPPTGRRDRLVQAAANLALRHAEWVATAPGMEHYNRQEFGVPLTKTLLLNNDVDLSVYRPVAPAERSRLREAERVPAEACWLLYVHRLNHDRGADYLIPVLERCWAAGRQVVLTAIGGSGDQEAALQAYAAAHPERLRLTGHLPNHRLPNYYAAADVFLMCSRGEGFPRVVLESMACGTPLIATDCGTTSRIIPPELRQALIAPVSDQEGFVGRLLALLEQPAAARERTGEQLRLRAQEYSVEQVARQYAIVLGAAAPEPLVEPRTHAAEEDLVPDER